jgi:hypothetical protein
MDRSLALVHVPGEGRWLRVSEPHSSERIQYLRQVANSFDEGFYTASEMAARLGFRDLKYRYGPRAAADYATHRDNLLNWTDDEILAARVALLVVGPARSGTWS